jgi:hypothetical protein
MAQHNSPPSQPLPLELPPAVLHAHSSPPHPDSIEYIESDRYRTAEELGPIGENSSVQQDGGYRKSSKSSISNNEHTSPSVRSRHSSTRRSSQWTSATASDNEDSHTGTVSRTESTRQVPNWYDPITKFWTSQISVTIDEGSHRDHLGMFIPSQTTQDIESDRKYHSPRTHIPRLPTNLPCPSNDRRSHSPTLPPPTLCESKQQTWVLCPRYPISKHIHSICHGRAARWCLSILAAELGYDYACHY